MNRLKSYQLIFYLLFAYFSYELINGVLDKDNFWDFEVYYYAIEADNPYSGEDIQELSSNQTKVLSYKYPPATLWVFKVFTYTSYTTALYLYVCFGLGAMLWLFFIAFKMNLLKVNPVLPWVFITAFGGTALLAFESGNVALVLSALLWWGFYGYTKENYLVFCFSVFVAACFKMFPIVLLFLLFFKRWPLIKKYFMGTSVAFFLYLTIHILAPEDLHNFLNALPLNTMETGSINPNAFTFSDNLGNYVVEHLMGQNHTVQQSWGLYFAIVLAILWIAFRGLKPYIHKLSDWEKTVAATLLLALIIPRFKDYDYVLVLPSTYFILVHQRPIIQILLAIVLIGIPSVSYDIPFISYLWELVWAYYPWLSCVLLGYMLLKIFREKYGSDGHDPLSTA